MRRPWLRLPPLDPLRLVLWAPLWASLIGLAVLYAQGLAAPLYVGLLLAVVLYDLLGLFGPPWVRARVREHFPVAYLLVLLGGWTGSFYVLPDHPATPMARLGTLLHTTSLYVFLFMRRKPVVAQGQSLLALALLLLVALPHSWQSYGQLGAFDGPALPLTLVFTHGTLILALRSFAEARVALAEAHARAQTLHELAHRDPLTGLLNRRALEHDLATWPWRVGALLAVMDVDGLKGVNDTLGHAAGDDLLRRFAHGLAQAAGPGGRAYRISGDEFALLLPGSAARNLEALVEAVAEEVRRTYPQAGASVGTASWQSGEGASRLLS